MSWSYSQLKDYETCPLRIRFTRDNVERIQSTEAGTGIDIHKAIENYLKENNNELPEIAFADDIANLRKHKAEAEVSLAINKNLEPCSWKVAWGRAIIDALIVSEKAIHFFDFKTGKLNPTKAADQAQIFAFFLSCYFPNLPITGKFLYLTEGKKKVFTFTPQDIQSRIRPIIETRIKRLESDTVLSPRPNKFVCGWCDYRKACEFSAAPEEEEKSE